MSFLTPLFLAGLAAIAVPVIIHLIQKERKNVVAFPSLMFLRRIPYESVNRRKIRNWPLLLLLWPYRCRDCRRRFVVFRWRRPGATSFVARATSRRQRRGWRRSSPAHRSR